MVFLLAALYLPTQTAIKIVAYFAFQLVVAFVLLAIVNDIERYGLQRKKAYGKRCAIWDAVTALNRHPVNTQAAIKICTLSYRHCRQRMRRLL